MADCVAKFVGEDNLSETLKKVKKELKETAAEGGKLDVIRQKFEKIQQSSAPLKRRLADIKKLLAEMNVNGLSNDGLYTELAQQAGQYADALSDASTAVSQFANDNLNLKAAAQGMQAVTGTASVLTGTMAMFGEENEDVQNAILKVQSALAICNGVQAVANVLNKDSALILKLRSLATTGAAVTTTTFSAALTKHAIVEALTTAKQKIATTVQVAWNVAKAIGMAMLGNYTGLALLAVGAIIGLAAATKSDTDETKRNNEEKNAAAEIAQAVKDKQLKAADEINSSTGKLIGSYKALQAQWNNLKNDQEKTQFLTDNKNKFSELGFSIDDVSSAEDFFVKSSAKVINALKARAEAAANYNNYVEALQAKYKLSQPQRTPIYRSNKKGEKKQDGNKFSYEGSDKGYDSIEEAQDAFRKSIQKDREAANQTVKYFEDAYFRAQQRLDEANAEVAQYQPKTVNTSGSSKSKSSSSKKLLTEQDDNNTLRFAQDYEKQLKDIRVDIPVDATQELQENALAIEKWSKEVERRKLIIESDVVLSEDSIDYAVSMLAQAQAELRSLELNVDATEGLQTAREQVEKWAKEVEHRKIALIPEVDLNENSLEYANDMLSKAKGALNSIDIEIIDPEDLQAALKQVDKWEEEVKRREIRLGLTVETPKVSIEPEAEPKTFKTGSTDDLRKSLANARSIADKVKSDFKDGLIDTESARQQIDDLNTRLQELGLKPIDIKFNEDGTLSSVAEDTESLKTSLESLRGTLDGLGGDVSGSVESFKSLAEVLGNGQATAAEQAGAALATVGNSLSQLGMEGAAAKAASVMAAIGQIILGFATASAQAGSLGPFGWLAFLGAGMGAATAIISQIKGFAEGGIIQGGSSHGDAVLARVNAGEMILNTRQQANLFNLLNSKGVGTNSDGGKVEFRISGDTLKGCLNNYQRKLDWRS